MRKLFWTSICLTAWLSSGPVVGQQGSDVGEEESRLDTLATEIAELQRTLRALKPPQDNVLDGISIPAEEQRRRDLEESRWIAEALDRALAAEPRDEDWATETERSIVAAVEALNPNGPVLVESACGTTFCRATTENALEQRSRDSPLEDLIVAPPFDTGGFIRVHEDESTVTVYFQRRGHTLPEVAAKSR